MRGSLEQRRYVCTYPDAKAKCMSEDSSGLVSRNLEDEFFVLVNDSTSQASEGFLRDPLVDRVHTYTASQVHTYMANVDSRCRLTQAKRSRMYLGM